MGGNGDGGSNGDDSSSVSLLPRNHPGTNEKDVTDWVVLVDRVGAPPVSLDSAVPGTGENGGEWNGSDGDLSTDGIDDERTVLFHQQRREDWEDDLYMLLNG